jgi:tripartite-type tricarboxylate transporter receptor subunit TctC
MRTPAQLVSVLLAAASFGAFAGPFPEKPVRVVVPFAPGGNVDIVTRIVAQAMGEELKQGVVVENRAGANGAVAAESVARAAPDGYTLLIAVAETHALNPSLRKALPYDPLKGFTSIGIIDRFPFSLVINPKLPATDVKSFIAHAREHPGKLNFSSWGNGSLSQVAFEQLKQATGIDLVHVPFNGAAPAMTALTAGSVQAFVVPLSLARPYAADGRVRLLAVTSEKRQDVAPEVPTLAEEGLPVVINGWHVLAAPAGTPDTAIETLNRALNVTLARAEVRDRLLKAGVQPAASTPREAQALVDAEYNRWGEIARKAGIRPE